MSRIFIAEDNEMCRAAMRIAFEGHGYDVVAAIDGQDLLRRLESQRADLIVLDLNMPGLSGLEVLRRLREDPRLATIPVLVASAQDDGGTRARCLALGAKEFHTKPFSLRGLAARVGAYLA
jgi:DNA-binding response OmpR family regulator